jgi:hypothetical protein
MAETVRLEEYTGLIQNKLVAVWQTPDATTPWLPTEFMLSQYITRILIAGRTSALSTAMAADPSWTQIWRSPGGKEWACLLGILQHMPGPVLIVVGPDLVLTPKLVAQLQEAAVRSASVFVLRSAGVAGWAGDPADQVFFPVIEAGGARFAGLLAAVQEWVGRINPKGIDLKPILPQLAAQSYGLVVANGIWQWYKPADSPPLASLTVAQIARQLHILGSVLEKTVA